MAISARAALLHSVQQISRFQYQKSGLFDVDSRSGDVSPNRSLSEHARLRSELNKIRVQLDVVSGNLARSSSSDQFAAIEKVFNQLKQDEQAIVARLEKQTVEHRRKPDRERKIQAAAELIDHLAAVTDVEGGLSAAKNLFDLVNLRLFLRFGNPIGIAAIRLFW